MSESKEYITQLEGQGNVHISEEAIATLAAMAAIEVEGVAALSSVGSDIADIAAKKNLSKGVRVRADGERLVIDLSLLVKFGSRIQTVAKSVQDSVTAAVESVVGLKLSAVNVHVAGVKLEG